MPIIINNETGLAENLPTDQAKSALDSGSHSLPFVDPEGNTVSIPYKEASQALSQQMRQPTQEELGSLMKYAKYSSPEQQFKAGAEGFAEGATLGLSPIIETSLGISTPEDIKYRKLTNPGISEAAKIGGLVASSVFAPEAGAAKALTSVGTLGKAAATALGATEATAVGRIGIAAAEQAAQMALLQTGDELSKQFVLEPEKSLGQSAIDVGLSSLMGAGVGGTLSAGKLAVSPLWKATKESQIAKTLEAVKARVKGENFVDDIQQTAQRAGIEVSPEVAARLSNDPVVSQVAKNMAASSGTKAGRVYQESLGKFATDVNQAVESTLGRAETAAVSEAQMGKTIKQNLVDSLKPVVESAQKAFEPVNKVLKSEVIPEWHLRDAAENLAQRALENGLHTYSGRGELKVVENIIKDLKNVKSFKEYADFSTRVAEHLKADKFFKLQGMVMPVLRNVEEAAEREVLERIAPGIVGQHAAARTGYREMFELVGALNKRLKVKGAQNIGKFMKNLESMPPETLVKKLGSEADSELLTLLSEKFPQVAQSVKQLHLNNIPLERNVETGLINVNKVFKHLNGLSEELKGFVMAPEQLERLAALEQLSGRFGKSKATRAVEDSLLKSPGGVAGLLSLLHTGDPMTAAMYYAAGKTGKKIMTEIPDALRLSALKMMGSSVPVSGAGFNAMYKVAESFYKGAAKQAKAVNNLFKAGTTGLGMELTPSAKSLNLLQRKIMAAETDPTSLMGLDEDKNDYSHYLPEHSTEMASTAARAVSYLASLKPDTGKANPLDRQKEPSEVEKARYNRALAIAEQPLLVLQHVKDGSVTADDVKAISAIYPSLYQGLKQDIMTKMIDHMHKGQEIPYQTRLGLSLFLGVPMESSIDSQNILRNQALYAQPVQAPKPTFSPSSAKSSLGKLPNIYATPQQLREQKKGK
jgi:hypothetical protein